jgi:class 3 adenylate cyclase/tetratricopeptide (TPR) repeat protein
VQCTSCDTENRPGRSFCSQCGTPLAVACPACGAANEPGDRFCGACGGSLEAAVLPSRAGSPTGTSAPGERRLVSVLFADLVGFTTLSEGRDPEEVRELLSRYFDRCRALIDRYGGTVEKFIGDAVMAVWGSPQAREDDAERAVRAALDLTAAVTALGEEVGMPDLRLRAGVVTGETSVRATPGEGLVVGDVVNTASRVQSIAPPGVALVDDVTRRATQASIAFEEAGEHHLKGREQSLHLWRALRVVANVGGQGRAAGLEAPLVGRDRELRAIIDALDGILSVGRARLVSVVGEAGMGKSRLGWELEKYVDGLNDTVLWHRGRCLSYGDGVAYWALADMVRMRAGIAEEEDAASARAKLDAVVERFVPDDAERRLVRPRLGALLGLERRPASDRADLFSGWRLFFERLADDGPVAMVFEDVHRADAGLLDFVEYLLEWSADRPILIVALGRPELVAQRPGWSDAREGATSVVLEPLNEDAMDTLLRGLVPGAPDELRQRIGARAEGVPLYATEIVRMLVDRGMLEQRGDRYELTAPVDEVEVPETLQALIAARLDGLSTLERRLLQDAAVLGLTFTASGLAAVSRLPEVEVQQALEGLVARQLVTLIVDPLSPDRGQYGFAQALVRRVAYGTLGRRERKERHLRAAAYLREAWGDEAGEVAELLAAHYLDAASADPGAGDAPQIAARARETLIAAGDRAASLAALEQAARYYVRAAELTEAPLDRAELLDRAGQTVTVTGRVGEARAHFEAAMALLEAEGQPRRAARVSARIGALDIDQGLLVAACERLESVYEVLAQGEPDQDLAAVAERLAAAYVISGNREKAVQPVEVALELAERLRLPETISAALSTKFNILNQLGRREEAEALLRHSLKLALDHDVSERALLAYNNIAVLVALTSRYEEALAHLDAGLALARRRGNRQREWTLSAMLALALFHLGRWDEAVAAAEGIPGGDPDALTFAGEASIGRARVHLARGEPDGFESALALTLSTVDDNPELRTIRTAARVLALLRDGDPEGALAVADEDFANRTDQLTEPARQDLLVDSLGAGMELGDPARVETLLERCRGLVARVEAPYLAAQVARFEARLAVSREDLAGAEQLFRRSAASLRELADPFALAVVLLEHAEALGGAPAEAETLRTEAAAIFARLGAEPWLARAEGLRAV